MTVAICVTERWAEVAAAWIIRHDAVMQHGNAAAISAGAAAWASQRFAAHGWPLAGPNPLPNDDRLAIPSMDPITGNIVLVLPQNTRRIVVVPRLATPEGKFEGGSLTRLNPNVPVSCQLRGRYDIDSKSRVVELSYTEACISALTLKRTLEMRVTGHIFVFEFQQQDVTSVSFNSYGQ